MKKKSLFILLGTILLASSCSNTPNSSSNSSSSNSSNGSENSSSASNISEVTSDRLVQLLNKINLDEIISYDLIDRSYAYMYYNNSQYIVSGDIKTGLVNYDATHNFKIYKNNFISDNIVVNSYDKVENPTPCNTFYASGEIYQEDDYIYDYFICASDNDQSFVNCTEIDYYHTFDNYFNYLSIIDSIKEGFKNPKTYFSSDDNYQEPTINCSVENGIEHYSLTCINPGTEEYKPIIVTFNVDYETSSNSFISIDYKIRTMLDSIESDYEVGTSSITSYTIKNIKFGQKQNYLDDRFSFDLIENPNSIHNAPKQIIDVSNKNNGNLDEETCINIINNISAYSYDIRQTNYSMIYHGAFDLGETNRTEFGDAKFEGKIVSYQDGITDNNGYIQLVNDNDLPNSEKAPYRIFTKAESYGILKGGKFSKYITSSFAFLSTYSFNSARPYLDANPLSWPEMQSVLSEFSRYKLGKNEDQNGSVFEIIVSGTKEDNLLTIQCQGHYISNSGSGTEYTDSFTFIIEDNKLSSVKFITNGTTSEGNRYQDIYQAQFVHGKKQKFNGEEMNILSELDNQVSWEDFYIIGVTA